MQNVQRTLALVALVAVSPVRVLASPGPEPTADARRAGGYLAGLATDGPVFGDGGAGALLALGDTWRMEFAPDAATYAPFLGPDAPRTWPVRFAVRSVRTEAGEVPFARAVEPVRVGRRVSYDRGPFVEVYDTAFESVEQSFVVHERLGGGALVIELDVTSDLARSRDAGGLVLEGERGGVRYSDAIAIDARGERIAAPTRWRDGRIEIEVPAAAVERLAFPLVVDPVLTSFSIEIDGGAPGAVVSSPVDSAYDATYDSWCMVHERTFANGVRDVHALFVEDGSTNERNFVLATSDAPTAPRVANDRTTARFLIVASVLTPSGFRRIRGQVYGNPTADKVPDWVPVTTGFYVSPDGSHASNPDVGGDGATASPSYFCVVWEHADSEIDHDIHLRMVTTNGTLHGLLLFFSNTFDLEGAPSISSSNGRSRSAEQAWTIAWSRAAGLLDSDLWAGRVRWDGAVLAAPFALDTSIVHTRAPSVSSPNDDATPLSLVAYTRGSVGSSQTWAFAVRGNFVEAHMNLTAFTGADPAENHIYPSVDCDGNAFVLVDTETWLGTTLYATYVSTLTWFGDLLYATEPHVQFASLSSTAQVARVTCQGASGGQARRTLMTYHYGSDDVHGTYYNAGAFTVFCEPGRTWVPDCPCGNAPSGRGRGCDNSSQTGGARLTATGAFLPDTIELVASDLRPSTTCVFAQASGDATTAVTFGDGMRCTVGTVRRLAVKQASGGVARFPEAGDPSITARSAVLGDPIEPGSARHYFVFYRDQNPTWACDAPFNATSALRVQW